MTTKPTKKITACRVCGNRSLHNVVNLGNQAVSGFVKSTTSSQTYPLSLILCTKCGLVQLAHAAVPAISLYRTYWYKSGVNASMRNALRDIVVSIKKRIRVRKKDIVLDIGANDGTLLGFWGTTVTRIGFEPARNLASEAKTLATHIQNDFFSQTAFNTITNGKKATVITTIAMFYDLEDPHSFVRDVSTSLAQDGVWVIQMASLLSTVTHTMFDNICHEHIEHYSLHSLEYVLNLYDLSVVDIEENDVNGGSIRVYVMKNSAMKQYRYKDAQRRIRRYRTKETRAKLTSPATYLAFRTRIESIKTITRSFILNEIKRGKIVFGYGASTKGNTLLQYYKLTKNELTAIAERNPSKWGKKTVETHIPIVSEQDARNAHPDYFFVLPWHFKKEFIRRERTYLRSGGALFFPLPHPHIVQMVNGSITEHPVT